MNKGFEGVDCHPYLEQISERTGYPYWAILIKGIREREGLTQKEFGEIIGCRHTTVHRLERGLSEDAPHIQAIEEIYGIKLR